jgi:hypothetical protein
LSSSSDQDGIPYNALSYTWGGLQHTSGGSVPYVFVGDHAIDVTENLYLALRHIREPREDVVLWVDAICINQQDPQEKGHQVKQMRNIYKNAERVLIWLGPSNDDIDILFESIRSIDKDRTSLCRESMSRALEAHNQPRAKQALAELVARPWFKRVWVLQEVANAKTARILCGSTSCPARTFALMPSLMGLRVSEHVQAVLDIMPQLRENTWWSSTRSLHFLLAKFVDSEAHFTRDKVYALLGMSEDAWNPNIFYPCYEKPDGDVFRDTACFLLFRKNLDKTYSFPYFLSPDSFERYFLASLRNLCLPIPQFAALTLGWILEEKKGDEEEDTSELDSDRWEVFGSIQRRFEKDDDRQRREALHKTADLLVSRMNDGRLKTADVLLSLAERHDQANRVRGMLPRGDVKLRVRLYYGRYASARKLVFSRPGGCSGMDVPIVVVFPHGLYFPPAISRRAPAVSRRVRVASRRVQTGMDGSWFNEEEITRGPPQPGNSIEDIQATSISGFVSKSPTQLPSLDDSGSDDDWGGLFSKPPSGLPVSHGSGLPAHGTN